MKLNLTILITGIAGDIAQSLARVLNGKPRLIGCDMAGPGAANLFVNKFYRVPPARDDSYLKEVKRILLQEKVNVFIPVTDLEISVVASQRSAFESMGIRCLVNTPEIVKIFSDKLDTARYIGRLGWKVPRTTLLRNVSPTDWKPPYVVKPRFGWGGNGWRLVRDEADVAHARIKDLGDMIAQEYIPEDEGEFTTGVFSNGEKTVSITFRRSLGPGGQSQEAMLVHSPFMEEMAHDLARSIGLKGSINIQTRKRGKIFIPFEVNPRLSSTMYIRHVFGFKDALWWMALLQNRNFNYIPRYHAGRAFRYLTEGFADLK